MKFKYSKKESLVPLFNFISEKDFEKDFSNGQFTGQIPEIITMVHVDSGVVLLTNEPKLYFIEIYLFSFTE